jgi:hypothetical protein
MLVYECVLFLPLVLCGLFFMFAAKAKGVVTYYTGIQSSHEYYILHLEEMLGLQLSVP